MNNTVSILSTNLIIRQFRNRLKEYSRLKLEVLLYGRCDVRWKFLDRR